ncbi:hypothetical protein, partial [Vibrio crassostreae]|uniref:hypothetical protein n=1 Tax=Vibrio crassostreae TaxID=246167 RepID=UPI001B31445F
TFSDKPVPATFRVIKSNQQPKVSFFQSTLLSSYLYKMTFYSHNMNYVQFRIIEIPEPLT